MFARYSKQTKFGQMTISDMVTNNSEENVCPVRETLGVWGIRTDFKLNHCQLYLHNSKE